MSTRPKPRPKPRPRPPKVHQTPPPSSPPTSSPTSSRPPQNTSTDDYEDNLFTRNAGRARWRKLEALERAKDLEQAKHSRESGSENGEDSDSSPPAAKRKKGSAPKNKNTIGFDWARKLSSEILISSDEEEDPILQNIENSKSSTKRPQRGADRDAKRGRSRSRSITPPPPVSAECAALMRARVKKYINPKPRTPSPALSADESVDSITLDPELAKIAREVQSERRRQQSMGPESRGGTPLQEGGPENVILKIKWVPHPLDDAALPQAWTFRVKRHDAFKQLYEEVAEQASILCDELIITLDGKRVFPFASPHGLDIWAEADLEASKVSTYDYIRSQRHLSPSTMEAGSSAAFLQTPLSTIAESQPSQFSEIGDDGQKFKLIVRSTATKDDVSLTVRPTTKCGAIVKAYLKAMGLTQDYPGDPPMKKGGRGEKDRVPAVQVDGDTLGPNVEIGGADLEDGDQIDIVGL
ncbi:hypothetical protein NLI96_g1448 [Meripilus lineatus]|uniref:Rad60/SUMO-like domain-containing protein n=1 Tax=Meripilus lineatus TaxID=2056292 RepID=A0AAD5VCK0_9APHY|nr:hypothetical protein NLI96_g1448 [Physisporinus lineatus]